MFRSVWACARVNVPAGLADLEAPQDFARGLRDAMDSVGGYEHDTWTLWVQCLPGVAEVRFGMHWSHWRSAEGLCMEPSRP